MDIQGYRYCHVPGQIPIQCTDNVSSLNQLLKIGSAIQKQGDSQMEWYKDSPIASVTGTATRNISNNFTHKITPQWEQWTSHQAPDFKSLLSMDATLQEEYMNLERLPCQLKSLIQLEIWDATQQAPICTTMPASLGMSPGFCSLNSECPQVDNFLASSFDHSTFFTNEFNHSSYFEGPAGYPCNGYNRGAVACDGKNMSPRSIKQVAGELAPSPEQISSIRACVEGDGYSNNEPFDGGPNFTGSSSQCISELLENCNQQEDHYQGHLNMSKYGGLMANDRNVYGIDSASSGEKLELPYLQRIPEVFDSESSLTFNTARATHKDSCQYQQLVKPQQCYQQPEQSYLVFDEPSNDKSNLYQLKPEHSNRLTGQRASKLLQLSTEQSHKAQPAALESSEVLFGLTGAAKYADSSSFSWERILFAYLSYKNKLVNKGSSHIPFLNHLHLKLCNAHGCNCDQYNVLVSHFDNCQYSGCSICDPVRRLHVTGEVHSEFGKATNDLSRAFCVTDFDATCSDTIEDFEPPSKRLKMESSVLFESTFSYSVAPSINQLYAPEWLPHLVQWPEAPVVNNVNGMEENNELLRATEDPMSNMLTNNDVTNNASMLNFNSSCSFFKDSISGSKYGKIVNTNTGEIRNDVTEKSIGLTPNNVPLPSEDLNIDHEEELHVASNSDQGKSEVNDTLCSPSTASESGIKSREAKIPGVSLADFFTAEQMREHISSLGQLICKKTMEEVRGNMACLVGENTCQLCAVDKLVFAPAPMYCACCGVGIKRYLTYYWMLDEMGRRHCFCTKCFRESRGGSILFQGVSVAKASLQKGRNNEQSEESWVQCDKCKLWQHQICALYNAQRDLEGKAEYICPRCCLEEIENGERVPLPKAAAFGAKDLPCSMLSDYIEERLFRHLKEEREERAKVSEKKFDEVPGAADLVVRVVLSVNKKLKVKQQFLDIVHNENYPTEFSYRSKVILLFQKIQGVDVCLFGMYVQEFGSECDHPNNRCIYISYLDSAKYFRPETKTVTGEALRTFVYHEILIGYLEYSKKRGFATCYIWACPPVKGEDYILYCHPETQKTPKSDKLRQWYKSMLRKAIKENVVVGYTNLYDHFFVPTGECNTKITAARLPYFDGGYWSGAAEDMIRNIEQESGGGLQKKMKKLLTKRTLKAMGHSDCSCDATKDAIVMQKLGQTILSVREDFIIAHLQYTCMHCHEVILSGIRWFCSQCKNFQLCARCLDVEQNLNETKTHASASGEHHLLSQVLVNNVSVDTEDKDITLDNEFFENRHTFLSFCQDNHYQFDTLRRAKHSSMMILYHLHNLTALTIRTTCSICHNDVSVHRGWHCEVCPELDVCDSCYQRKDGACHIHKLTHRSSIANTGMKNKKTQKQKALWARRMLDLLTHVIQCQATKTNSCSYPNCIEIRKLFRHTHCCNLRAVGGCKVCQKTWVLIRLHSRNCRDSDCRMPRCMDLKRHAEMLTLQSEARRRDAVGGLSSP